MSWVYEDSVQGLCLVPLTVNKGYHSRAYCGTRRQRHRRRTASCRWIHQLCASRAKKQRLFSISVFFTQVIHAQKRRTLDWRRAWKCVLFRKTHVSRKWREYSTRLPNNEVKSDSLEPRWRPESNFLAETWLTSRIETFLWKRELRSCCFLARSRPLIF